MPTPRQWADTLRHAVGYERLTPIGYWLGRPPHSLRVSRANHLIGVTPGQRAVPRIGELECV